ncbi:hypothetical protein F4861DRAFT_119518 [Xylaria intraflava]|nr:hypothetical protein F4861DRAFT_119518 [Xylaria intraflava]
MKYTMHTTVCYNNLHMPILTPLLVFLVYLGSCRHARTIEMRRRRAVRRIDIIVVYTAPRGFLNQTWGRGGNNSRILASMEYLMAIAALDVQPRNAVFPFSRFRRSWQARLLIQRFGGLILDYGQAIQNRDARDSRQSYFARHNEKLRGIVVRDSGTE